MIQCHVNTIIIHVHVHVHVHAMSVYMLYTCMYMHTYGFVYFAYVRTSTHTLACVRSDSTEHRARVLETGGKTETVIDGEGKARK